MSVAIAEEIADAHAEFLALVESCSDEEWRAVCRAERWRIGVVAHHIAWGHERTANWINSIRSGIPIRESPEERNASNRIRADQAAGIKRDEVIFLARRNAEHLIAVLRSLTEEDFNRTVSFGPSRGRPISIAALGRGHLDGHLASMRATLRR